MGILRVALRAITRVNACERHLNFRGNSRAGKKQNGPVRENISDDRESEFRAALNERALESKPQS